MGERSINDIDFNNRNSKFTFVIPTKVKLTLGEAYPISGKGFAIGDKIVFTSINSAHKTTVAIDVKMVTHTGCTFTVPCSFVSGTYQITVERDGLSLSADYTLIKVVPPRRRSGKIKKRELSSLF